MHLILVGREKQYNQIDQLAEQDPPPDWVDIFQLALPEIRHATNIISQMGPFFPEVNLVFTAFDRCPFPPKVVIIGQDPYHSVDNGNPQACGMAFSTRKGCPIQPSLINIYKELKLEYPEFSIPSHGDLTKWANQGVLLLNTCLTVRPHQPRSHMTTSGTNIWSGFVEKILSKVNAANPNCVYLLWGADAQRLIPSLGQNTIKLIATHPSWKSATKMTKTAPAFIGSNIFRCANQALIETGKPPIDWLIE